ncbi:MAG: hypothetical protein ACYS0F_02115 [Planctomycetota bacterium]|jgi:hypothetical protein
MSETTTATPSYARYWKAWAALLVITLLMVFLPSSLPVILVGIGVKVAIIASVFMHLSDETVDFVIIVGFNILFFSLILYGLIAPDGLAM